MTSPRLASIMEQCRNPWNTERRTGNVMKTSTITQQGFPAVAPESAAVLILGSFPGVASLEKKRYYAHPRNGFWAIMAQLLDFDPDSPYRERLEILKENRIALWDVLYRCRRSGSLDSSIEPDSVAVNDFASFFREQRKLKAILFNGARAETEFKKRVVLPERLAAAQNGICCIRLPSTSPAMASLSMKQKAERWRILQDYLDL